MLPVIMAEMLPAFLNKQHFCNTRLQSKEIRSNVLMLHLCPQMKMISFLLSSLTSPVLFLFSLNLLFPFFILHYIILWCFYVLENIPFSKNKPENKHGLLPDDCFIVTPLLSSITQREHICRTVFVLLATLLTKSVCSIL